MQDSVNQKFIEPVHGAHAAMLGFRSSGICRDYHVTQKLGGDLGKFALAHGKGNYICRPPAVEISVIKFCDLRIIYNQDGNFAVRTVQGV